MPNKKINGLKCDVCGKFIAFKDFDNGAICEIIAYSDEYTDESYITLCKKHADTENA